MSVVITFRILVPNMKSEVLFDKDLLKVENSFVGYQSSVNLNNSTPLNRNERLLTRFYFCLFLSITQTLIYEWNMKYDRFHVRAW